MTYRNLAVVCGAAALAVGLASSAPASAGTVWNVSIAGPGYAIAAGDWGPRYYGRYRHGYRPYVVAPIVYSAPVVVERAYVYPQPVVVYPAPRVFYRAPLVIRRW